MKYSFYFLVWILCAKSAYTQQVIASDGGYGISIEGSLSWTLGEVITETFANTNNYFTQGFQQNYEDFVFINELIIDEGLTFYPNPFNSSISLDYDGQNTNYTLIIYDYQNKLVFQKDILFSPTYSKLTIDLSELAAGCYFFTLQNSTTNKQIVQRIIKLKDDH